MNPGIAYAALAYLCWGLFPLYFRQLTDVPALEVVLHRTLWSLVFVLGVLAVRRQWAWMAALLRQPRVLGALDALALVPTPLAPAARSDERRVGKECGCRG